MNLGWKNPTDAVFHHAAERPDAPAIIEGGGTITYRDLAALVGEATVYLERAGIGKGAHIAIAMRNSADHLILSLAIMRIGAVLVEVPPLNTPSQLLELARKFDTRHTFVDIGARLPGEAKAIAIPIDWRVLLAENSGARPHDAAGDELGYIMVTFGSTGIPKGATATHRERMRRFRGYIDTLFRGALRSPAPPRHFLLLASLGNTAFFGGAFVQFLLGGAVVIAPDFGNAVDFAHFVASWQDAIATVTANMCRTFAALGRPGGMLLPGMRALVTSGLPLSASEKRAVAERVTPNLYELYGTAGTGTVSCLYPADIAGKAASVGRPIPGVAVEIVDASRKKLPTGAVGCLRCRLLESDRQPGFYGQGEMVAGVEGTSDGWFYPGDMAMLDAEGYLFLKGLAVEVIRRGPTEILPGEIEEVLLAHPGVRAAAVVGRPAATGGEEVIAFVVAGAKAQEELLQHCLARLAPEKRPNAIYLVKSLPLLATGAVDKAKLKAAAVEAAAKTGTAGGAAGR
jgi:acyl-CoA synthetase (AMP-forming)/AMP-acid ligase II